MHHYNKKLTKKMKRGPKSTNKRYKRKTVTKKIKLNRKRLNKKVVKRRNTQKKRSTKRRRSIKRGGQEIPDSHDIAGGSKYMAGGNDEEEEPIAGGSPEDDVIQGGMVLNPYIGSQLLNQTKPAMGTAPSYVNSSTLQNYRRDLLSERLNKPNKPRSRLANKLAAKAAAMATPKTLSIGGGSVDIEEAIVGGSPEEEEPIAGGSVDIEEAIVGGSPEEEEPIAGGSPEEEPIAGGKKARRKQKGGSCGCGVIS